MAMLPVLLGMRQRCPACGQRSSPGLGQGDGEIMGLWNGSIDRCTKCGQLVRVGVLTDHRLTPQEAEAFLAARAAHLRG